MRKLTIGMIAIVGTASLAYAAGTKYEPHFQAGAVPAAFQMTEERAGGSACASDDQVLACVVQLGPTQGDHWAYLLNDTQGAPNAEVKFTSRADGAPCSAKAYPRQNVALLGGTGDWFKGELRFTCRR